MPIYEYECAKCHQVTEAMQKFSDKPLSKCPHCGGKMSKLMSMNSFQLKGGGWYATDYAKKAVPPPATKSTPATETSSTSSVAADKPAAEKPATTTAKAESTPKEA